MSNFWEESFVEKKAMWGFKPSNIAVKVADYFAENNLKGILIPGIGYGRNAKPFLEHQMDVTGIEISQTAIDMARKNDFNQPIFLGSVSDMPYEDKQYDGIASFALIHLLNEEERKKFIEDCYNQLKPGGQMVITAVSEKAPMYGKGKEISENFFEMPYGVNLFFYNKASIEKEFEHVGLIDVVEIDEVSDSHPEKPGVNFLMITCKKA